MQTEENLIWLDMEMTGLNPEVDLIMEIAVVVTDKWLNSLYTSPSYAIYVPAANLEKMDAWNQATHSKTGLIDRCKSSNLSVEDVEKELLLELQLYTVPGANPLCGSTIYQDRKFVTKYMQHFEAHLHYRMVDVSSIKELFKRWYANKPKFSKSGAHRALDDILESIEELKFYRDNIFLSSDE